jgi:glycosyltransferase involved in cell wall biosynthesis
LGGRGDRPLRIGLDALRALRNTTGLGNYSRGVLQGLHAVDPTLELHLYSPATPRPAYAAFPAEVGGQLHLPPAVWQRRGFRAMWRTFRLGRAARRDGVDLFHGLSHEIPRDLPRTGLPSVVTFLDLIYHHHPEYFPAFDRRSYEWRYHWSAEHARAIVAISGQTRDDLVATYGIPAERIRVVPPARDPRFAVPCPEAARQAVRTRHGVPERFLLSVGTLEPRKNQALAIEALALLGPSAPDLVLVGRDGGSAATLRQLAESRGVAGRVRILSGVTQEELPALVQSATIFLYPSFIEGFGMPIVEALSAGVPVVTTAGGCFAEAGGSAARYIDPTDASGLAAVIAQILADPALAETMREAGRRHAEGFDAAALARRLLGVYDAVIADRPLPVDPPSSQVEPGG